MYFTKKDNIFNCTLVCYNKNRGDKMQASQTYSYEKNDHVNRANIALACSSYFGIKDVSPDIYKIAAPVSELAYQNREGQKIRHRDEIEYAIPWNERSMKTFGVVYRYEALASFIGIDGKTYVVPNDQPVIDHLQECGYLIAPYGMNFDGSATEVDSLIYKSNNDFFEDDVIDRNLPDNIINAINEIEKDRPYYTSCQSYASVLRFGGTLGIHTATLEELQQLSLSERKVANILTYARVIEPQNIEEYVAEALQHPYLNDKNFVDDKQI